MSDETSLSEVAQRWDARYRQGDIPWDLDGSSAVVQRLASRLFTSPCRLLVPGCGMGHDAAALAQLGHEVVGLDLSPTAVELATRRHRDVSGLSFRQGDFFRADDTLGTFDAIVEHTCYCAVGPELNPTYVQAAAGHLRQGGVVFGAFLNFEGGGPPHGTNPEELTQTFAPYFETEHLLEVSETFTSRAYPQLEGVFRLQRTER
jgi:SAM-dependent methyltransferase